jgi:hypothetical protein
VLLLQLLQVMQLTALERRRALELVAVPLPLQTPSPL